jgi:Cu/Ag efflux protein CusF
MKKAVSISLALLFVFAITSVSFAAEEKKTAPATEEKAMPAVKAKVKQVTGDVKAVDMKAKTITVTKMMKDKAEETVATVDDKTKIMMGEEKKALADVKVGEKVKVVYKEVEGKNVAKSITIMPAAKKAEPTKPTEKK